MNALEILELALRRLHAKRLQEHQQNNAVLDINIQDFMRDLADELSLLNKASKK